MGTAVGQWLQSSRDREMFAELLKALENKTWREALVYIQAEFEQFGRDHRRYGARLIRLCSYLLYPTKDMAKEYQHILLSMVDLPELLAENLAKSYPPQSPSS